MTQQQAPPGGSSSGGAMQSIVIRAGCEDHPNGNITGEDCNKCDVIRRTTPQTPLGGHMMMHSRNSCKTLKCPKCNWHYKYQETLEIHMKEKHPDTETQCVYCITKQAHPRLARGEIYHCGYKPYRCEVTIVLLLPACVRGSLDPRQAHGSPTLYAALVHGQLTAWECNAHS